MYGATSSLNFALGVASSTGKGADIIGQFLYIPIKLFLTFTDEIILIAVFGAIIGIAWSLWRRWV